MATKVNNVYDASSISILEGLEAVRKKTGNVHRKRVNKGT